MTPIKLLTDHFNVRCICIYDNPGEKKLYEQSALQPTSSTSHGKEHVKHYDRQQKRAININSKNYSEFKIKKEKDSN